MTDRIATLTVTLTHDMRDDDCEAIISLIQQIRCVASVTMGPPVGPMDHVTRERAKWALRDVLRAKIDEALT